MGTVDLSCRRRRPSGKAPQFFFGGLARLDQSAGQRVVVAEMASAYSSPSATRISALPGVARSAERRAAWKVFCAYHMASARTKRPSASVFRTSTVWPSRRGDDVACALRVARGHVFDQSRRCRRHSLRPCVRAAPVSAPMTAAEPAMSYFMSPMPAAGLIEMPPVVRRSRPCRGQRTEGLLGRGGGEQSIDVPLLLWLSDGFFHLEQIHRMDLSPVLANTAGTRT